MKKRTFFVMLILFLVFLNSMVLVVSTVILNDKLSAAKDKCLAEHYVIASYEKYPFPYGCCDDACHGFFFNS